MWISPPLAAYHVFQIPHIAGDGWITSITLYNEGDRAATATLRQWNDAGIKGPETLWTVVAHGHLALTQEDLLAGGVAAVSTDEDKIRVKLSYQYGYSQSLCELFVDPDADGTQWLVPNSRGDLFSWFGVVVANLGKQTASISMTAFKDGVEVKSASFPLKPNRKRLALSAELWNLESREVDAVFVTSDKPIPAPLGISGVPDQSRHLFLAGDRVGGAAGERRFFVPHIGGDLWSTQVVIYNFGADPATFSLHQYDDSGTEINTISQKMPPKASVTFSTGRDGRLPGSGSALITGRGALSVRLSYRYRESESSCEFFANGDTSRKWFLPNPMRSWFDWFGIAIQNPAGSSTNALIRAYRDGVELTNAEVLIGPRQKYAALPERMLGLNPWDFDMLSIETSQSVPMPLYVIGTQAQDRHLFFGGQALAGPSKLRSWALLFYDDAKFPNAYVPTRDFSLEAYSGPNLDVLILEGTADRPTTLYYVNPNRSLAVIDPPDEKNMGDSNTLYDFIMKAKTDFPAERYVLAFYDHGQGWQGCCIDQSSSDILSMDEMQRAISRAGGVDLALFTAPCLMGELESVYELRDWTDVYVGSEDLSAYIWFGTIQFIRSTLEADPVIGNKELGRSIVDSIVKNMPAIQSRFGTGIGGSYTMSAIDTRAISQLVADLNALSTALLAQPLAMNDRIDAIWSSVQNYNDYFSIDLYDFLEKYGALETRAEIKTLIRKAQESLNACVLAEGHGPANSGSHGLSIYFPLPPNLAYQDLYSDPGFGLDFPADTQWDKLIRFHKGVVPRQNKYPLHEK
ncbi:MAG: hypothetical protein LAP85_04810 [Acidobacteriia bacterium]|nr:hypothetical protein [Terriglobia bacterium]